MNTKSRSSGLLTNSLGKHHRKCVEDSLENNTYQFRGLTEEKKNILCLWTNLNLIKETKLHCRDKERQFLRYCQWLQLVCYFRQNQRIFLISKHWPVFPYKFLYLCSKHTLHLSIRISNIQSFSLCKFFSADQLEHYHYSSLLKPDVDIMYIIFTSFKILEHFYFSSTHWLDFTVWLVLESVNEL